MEKQSQIWKILRNQESDIFATYKNNITLFLYDHIYIFQADVQSSS